MGIGGGMDAPSDWQAGSQGWQGGSGSARGAGSWVPVFVGFGVIVLLVVAIVVVLVSDDGSGGRGDGGDGGDERRPDVDLRTVLLTRDDVGEGYEPQPLEEEGEGEYEGGPECEPLMAVFNETGQREATAEAVYRTVSTDQIRRVEHYLDWADEYPATLAEMESAMSQCPSYSWQGGGDTSSITLQLVPTGGLGDATLSYALESDFVAADGFETNFGMFVIMWERDGVRSTVIQSDGRDSSQSEAPPGTELATRARELAEIADARLADVLGS